MPEKPIVARLNARTTPMSALEREVLAEIDPVIIELEGQDDAEIVEKCSTADAIMIISAYLRGAVIRQLPKLKIISRLGTGVEKIDIAEATRQGVFVTYLPDYSTEEVADHTLALLLAAARRLKKHEALMRTGKRPDSVFGMHRLAVQTLGIAGFGRIARAVARRARGFGMRLLAFDPYVDEEIVREHGAEPADMERLLTESDFLSLLCPLTETTREMISMRELKKMKPTAIIVNTGRGELVNENDLAEALRTGVIQYAAVDVFGAVNVFAEGGFSTNHPFFSVENMLLTPHVSANAIESGQNAQRGGACAVVEVLSGRYPTHPVNPEVKPKIALCR